MTPIADMVAEMLARGVAADIVVIAVKAAEQAMASTGKSAESPVDEAAEKRRAYDRARKAEKRKSGGSPVESPRTSEASLSLTSLSKDSEQKKEVKKVRARKHPLPPEFQPDEGHFAAALKLGKPRQYVIDKCEDMRIWAGSSGALKVDWGLTLHGFMRRDAANPQKNNVITAADELVDTMRQWETKDDLLEDLRSGEGASNVRLLSTHRGG